MRMPRCWVVVGAGVAAAVGCTRDDEAPRVADDVTVTVIAADGAVAGATIAYYDPEWALQGTVGTDVEGQARFSLPTGGTVVARRHVEVPTESGTFALEYLRGFAAVEPGDALVAVVGTTGAQPTEVLGSVTISVRDFYDAAVSYRLGLVQCGAYGVGPVKYSAVQVTDACLHLDTATPYAQAEDAASEPIAYILGSEEETHQLIDGRVFLSEPWRTDFADTPWSFSNVPAAYSDADVLVSRLDADGWEQSGLRSVDPVDHGTASGSVRVLPIEAMSARWSATLVGAGQTTSISGQEATQPAALTLDGGDFLGAPGPVVLTLAGDGSVDASWTAEHVDADEIRIDLGYYNSPSSYTSWDFSVPASDVSFRLPAQPDGLAGLDVTSDYLFGGVAFVETTEAAGYTESKQLDARFPPETWTRRESWRIAEVVPP
jgi:hypothetical protein